MNYIKPTITRLRGDEISVTDQMRAQAFWLIQKYTSLTYIGRMLDLYTSFLRGYEQYAKRQTSSAQYFRENLETMFRYQGLLERGVKEISQGYKSGYATVAQGCGFGSYVIGRRFENGLDWETLGYRREGPCVGLFAWAMLAIQMSGKVELTLEAKWAFPNILDPFFITAPLPDSLPPAPRPDPRVLRRDHEVPKSGAWVPRDFPNPCPNYLIEGRPAPHAQRVSMRIDRPEIPAVDNIPATPPRTEYEYESQPTSWQLQWEDRRYLDGKIPGEESVYLDPTTEPPPWPANADDVVS